MITVGNVTFLWLPGGREIDAIAAVVILAHVALFVLAPFAVLLMLFGAAWDLAGAAGLQIPTGLGGALLLAASGLLMVRRFRLAAAAALAGGLALAPLGLLLANGWARMAERATLLDQAAEAAGGPLTREERAQLTERQRTFGESPIGWLAADLAEQRAMDGALLGRGYMDSLSRMLVQPYHLDGEEARAFVADLSRRLEASTLRQDALFLGLVCRDLAGAVYGEQLRRSPGDGPAAPYLSLTSLAWPEAALRDLDQASLGAPWLPLCRDALATPLDLTSAG